MQRQHVTVRVDRRFNQSAYLVAGYDCTVAGLPMVVHRSIERESPHGSPVLSKDTWTVTEPRSGMCIGHRIEPTRERAIAHAEHVVTMKGGACAVEQAIARVTA